MRTNPLIKKVFEAGEAQIDRLVGQILTNERFVFAVQSVVSRTLAAKGNLDKSIRAGLATMNLPSTQDIEDLRGRLDELDRSLADLDKKLSHMEKELSEKVKAQAAPRASRPRTSKSAAKSTSEAASTKKAAPKKTTAKASAQKKSQGS